MIPHTECQCEKCKQQEAEKQQRIEAAVMELCVAFWGQAYDAGPTNIAKLREVLTCVAG